MFLKWTKRLCSLNRPARLLNYLILITLVCQSIDCQNSSDTQTTTTTTTTTTSTAEPSINTTGELLLSKDEFVDYTEAPTLLFDGLSNEAKSNDSEIKPNNQENNNKSSESETTTTTTTTTEPTINVVNVVNSSTSETTTPIETTTTTTEANNEASNDEAEESEAPEEDEPSAGLKEPTKRPFEPPQNVSQYMDYIETLFHDLRHQITDLFEPHIPQLIRTSQMVQLSNSCSYDMLRMALALRQFQPWALRMIDSSGKVPEGIFEGSFTALGSYDECINTMFDQSPDSSSAPSAPAQPSTSSEKQQQQQQQQQSAAPTQGKYCLVNVSPFLPPKPPADKVERMFQDEANRRNLTKDDQFSRLSPMFYYMKFRIGVCIPSTCDATDMESISSALSSSLRLNITIPDCRIKQLAPLTNHQLIGGSIFGLLLALVFGATLIDWSRRKWDQIERQEFKVISGQLTKTTTTANKRNDNVIGPTSLTLNFKLRDQQVDCDNHHEDDDDDDDDDIDSREARLEAKSFTERLNTSWSWMSFSLLTNFKLYFRQQQRSNLSQNEFAANYRKSSHHQQVENESLTCKSTKQDNQRVLIKCLNGIRVLSLCWVIVANSYITLDPRATKRLVKTREAPRDFLFQVVVQASLAIETFFFLSGVLMSLSFSRKLRGSSSGDGHGAQQSKSNNHHHQEDGHQQQEEKQRTTQSNLLKWAHFYIHRYVRMTPATMLVIAFSMYAYRYGDGPLWLEATQKAHQSCSVNWWRHLLHVANFIDTRQMCFIHYWYIAADMQLFLFAPLVMMLLYRYRRLGVALIGLIGASSIGFVFYTTYARNLPPTLLFYNSDPESRREFGNSIMTKPLTHALPYMVGMLVGCWLNSQLISQQQSRSNKQPADQQQQRQPWSSKWSLFELANNSYGRLSWTTLFGSAATVVALVEVFLPYKWNNSHLPTRLMASLYAALFRFGWSLVLAYVVISCRHKRGRRCAREQSRQLGCCCQHSSHGRQQQVAANNNHTPDHQNRSSTTTTTTTKSDTSQEYCLCGAGGNLVNRLLSLDIFTHLSKLSFVAYLIHLPLMSVFISQTRGLFAFSHTLVIHLALSYLVMTFVLSFILVHIIEFPFITFEIYLFNHLFSRTNKSPANSETQDSHHKRSGKYHISGEFHHHHHHQQQQQQQHQSHQQRLNVTTGDIYKRTNLAQLSQVNLPAHGPRFNNNNDQQQQQQQHFMAYPAQVRDEPNDDDDGQNGSHCSKREDNGTQLESYANSISPNIPPATYNAN